MQARLLAPLLALLAVLPGCLNSFDGLPQDPAKLSYILPATSAEKASHPVAYQGTFSRLDTTGVTWTVEAQRAELHLGGRIPPEASFRPGAPFTLRGVSGSLVSGGTTYSFTDADVSLGTGGGDPVVLQGPLRVESRVDAKFVPGNVLLTPPLVDVQVSSGDPSLALRLQGDGTVSSTHVRFTRGAPGGFPSGGATGTLTLTPTAGPIGMHGAGVRLAPTGDLAFDATAPSFWAYNGASAPVTVRGAAHEGPVGVLSLTEARGSLKPATLQVDLTGKAKQWIRDGHPEFQAAFAIEALDGPFRVARGENTSLWLKVSETGRVGTAVGARPTVLDNGSLVVGTGLDWYSSADPHALEVFGTGFKNVFFGLFVDFRVTDFDPGETKYLALYVEAPEDAAPGPHTVRVELKGHNVVRTVDVPIEVQ